MKKPKILATIKQVQTRKLATHASLPSRSKHLSRSKRKEKHSDGSRSKQKWKKYVNWKILLALICLPILSGSIYLSYLISKVPENANAELQKPDSPSTLADRNGNTITKIGTQKIEPVKLDDLMKVNPKLPATLIKVEDQRFWKHDGVDFWGLTRAVFDNLKGRSGGGGTIPMQVARNMVLDTKQKTLQRKVNEIVSAQKLIDTHKHEGVLEAYLNYIDFGPTIQGVQAASKFYFGKDLIKTPLTDEEVALLVAIPNNPTRLNPKGNEEQKTNAKERRDWILQKKMTNSEDTPAVISMKEAEIATEKPLQIAKDEQNTFLNEFKIKSHGAYIDLVRTELKERYGITKEDLRTNAYEIKIAIDPEIDKTIENEIKNTHFEGDSKTGTSSDLNSSFMVMDRNTGHILALSSGKDYIPGGLNWGVTKQQPGSSIMPLAVYSPYLEFHKDTNEYTPVGTTPLAEVVANSSGYVATRLFENEITVNRGVKFLQDTFQLSLEKKDLESPSAIVTGDLFKGYSPVQMAQAYSVFPNNGKLMKVYTILEVKDNKQNKIEPLPNQEIEPNQSNAHQVLSTKTSYYMTRMLKGVVENPKGPDKGAKIPGFEVAGKTGTTPNKRSGWFVGFTPDYVASAVVFNEPKDGKQGDTKVTGDSVAEMWGKIMAKVVKNSDKHRFEKPADVPEPIAPMKLQNFDISISSEGTSREIKINIIGGSRDSNVTYRVERVDSKGKYLLVTEGAADSLKDTFAPVDPNSSNQKFTYKIIAKSKDTSVIPVVVEKELTLQKLKAPSPEREKKQPDSPPDQNTSKSDNKKTDSEDEDENQEKPNPGNGHQEGSEEMEPTGPKKPINPTHSTNPTN
ncbi:membrane peptidoglycan carboxypeptidase [Croceifilum oryzae]|uniref:Membrane peptidoglycan carboxypeptidase n=1 Tax=Croceifilum oryzae TaxID=1553429 RepID=A0AAJ1TCN4_9BACL|nr:transglycosylase domain-containing protein [Croceifilum oryzae]MDQ0415959.1 membrane peptidoglycan carboxypeptidase [Croceifilum oryzae]